MNTPYFVQLCTMLFSYRVDFLTNPLMNKIVII